MGGVCGGGGGRGAVHLAYTMCMGVFVVAVSCSGACMGGVCVCVCGGGGGGGGGRCTWHILCAWVFLL